MQVFGNVGIVMVNVDIVIIKLVIVGFFNYIIICSLNWCFYWCYIVSIMVSFNLFGYWMELVRIKVRRDVMKIEW